MRNVLESLVGVDTPFLIAHSILEHPGHSEAVCLLDDLLDGCVRDHFAVGGSTIPGV